MFTVSIIMQPHSPLLIKKMDKPVVAEKAIAINATIATKVLCLDFRTLISSSLVVFP